MPQTGPIRIRVIADTRAFRTELLKLELHYARSRWARARIRIALWRIRREPEPV